MTNSDEKDDVSPTEEGYDVPLIRCPVCGGRGEILTLDQKGNRTVIRCPVCRGRGRTLRGTRMRGPRVPKTKRLFTVPRPKRHSRSRPPRGPLLPLTVRPRDEEPVRLDHRRQETPLAHWSDQQGAVDFTEDSSSVSDTSPLTETAMLAFQQTISDLLIRLANATGLEPYDLASLRLADIVGTAGTICIRRSGYTEPIHIPFPEELRAELFAFLPQRAAIGASQSPESRFFWCPPADLTDSSPDPSAASAEPGFLIGDSLLIGRSDIDGIHQDLADIRLTGPGSCEPSSALPDPITSRPATAGPQTEVLVSNGVTSNVTDFLGKETAGFAGEADDPTGEISPMRPKESAVLNSHPLGQIPIITEIDRDILGTTGLPEANPLQGTGPDL